MGHGCVGENAIHNNVENALIAFSIKWSLDIFQKHWENTCWRPHTTILQTSCGEEGWQTSLESIQQ